MMLSMVLLRLTVVLGALAGGALAGCSAGPWREAYGGERCYVTNGIIVMRCNDKGSGANCGMRLTSGAPVGSGQYTVSLRAAPGAGVATTYYVSTSGANRKDHPWNEIDFEIHGNMARPGSTLIWTNFFTGTNVEHHRMIRVPFDASAGFHSYTIDIDGVNSVIRWLVDDHVYRVEPVGFYGDMKYAIRARRFRPYLSLWGLGPGDHVNANGQFMNAMSRLDRNPHRFPIRAAFRPTLLMLPHTSRAQQPAAGSRAALPGAQPVANGQPAAGTAAAAGQPGAAGASRLARVGKFLPALLGALYAAALAGVIVWFVCLCVRRGQGPHHSAYSHTYIQDTL